MENPPQLVFLFGNQKKSIVKMVNDPFGNQIGIQQEMLQLTDQMESDDMILDDITTVIEKPAMMFKINGNRIELYYLRAISWNKLILVSAQKRNDHFEVTNCEVDPSAKRLAELYYWADQLM
jgi:hypothetical protein